MKSAGYYRLISILIKHKISLKINIIDASNNSLCSFNTICLSRSPSIAYRLCYDCWLVTIELSSLNYFVILLRCAFGGHRINIDYVHFLYSNNLNVFFNILVNDIHTKLQTIQRNGSLSKFI